MSKIVRQGSFNIPKNYLNKFLKRLGMYDAKFIATHIFENRSYFTVVVNQLEWGALYRWEEIEEFAIGECQGWYNE